MLVQSTVSKKKRNQNHSGELYAKVRLFLSLFAALC